MDRIKRICNDLGMLKFINDLPQGFDTNIANNGAILSGGQKQRLAIARALYRPFEILILDEPTSSIDSVSESYIQAKISELKVQKKSIVVIAHRLSTVKEADSIIFVDSLHKIYQGTHQELYAKNQQYIEFWNAQRLPEFEP